MSNLNNLRQILKKNNLDAILISSVPNIIYLTGYSGFSRQEREAYLFISKDKNYIITDARYSEAVNTLRDFKLIEISSTNSLKKCFSEVFKNPKKLTVGFESTDLHVNEFNLFKTVFKKLKSVDLTKLRIKKCDEEIEKIKTACKIGDEAFEYIITKIRPGITEKELALDLEMFVRKKGASLSFDTIVAYGKNAATPHHLSSSTKLKGNDLILLDFGVKKDNYCSDITRVVFFGKATKKHRNVYQTVLKSNQKAIAFLKEKLSSKQKVKASEVDKVARDCITKENYPSIPHSLGHGVGIEIHEAPRLSPHSKEILENGMVFSIEPGIYEKGWGGVRIEDLVAISEGKLEVLTRSPKKLIEL